MLGLDAFLKSPTLWRRNEVLARPSPVPKARGIYAWYFRTVPPMVPVVGAHMVDSYSLLYIGIAPSSDDSRSTLRSRLRSHFRGNASSSTLRLTLGCLLADSLGLRLTRQDSGRFTLASEGEALLSEWLEENAAVAWTSHERPWLAERGLIQQFKTPLNLAGNAEHPFAATLSERRRAFRASATPRFE